MNHDPAEPIQRHASPARPSRSWQPVTPTVATTGVGAVTAKSCASLRVRRQALERRNLMGRAPSTPTHDAR